jgi:YtkA-like
MKRNLLILALGISFLIGMTWLGTMVDTLVPHKPTPQTQAAQAGPYQLTLQVDPNPPPITRPATLSLLIVYKGTQQAVTNAHITLQYNMETMDMGIDRVDARSQQNGLYFAQVQFSMSGPWQVQAFIAVPGQKTEQVTFEITAQ